jgi:hypothetical protein
VAGLEDRIESGAVVPGAIACLRSVKKDFILRP